MDTAFRRSLSPIHCRPFDRTKRAFWSRMPHHIRQW